LKFIDESGVNLAMTRRFGRAPRGERVIGTVPQNYGANLTMMAALSLHGIEAVMTIEGATDAEAFMRTRSRSWAPCCTWAISSCGIICALIK
jgi:hypothetical protein